MKLYEISGEIAKINEELEANGAELLPYMEERFSALHLSMHQKAEGIGGLVLNDEDDLAILEGQMVAAKMRYEDLQAKVRAKENKINLWKAYLHVNMQHAGIEKIDLGPFKVRVQKNGGKPNVDVIDESKVPARFMDIVPAYTVVNKDRIREAAANGEDVSGFAKVEAGTHLRID